MQDLDAILAELGIRQGDNTASSLPAASVLPWSRDLEQERERRRLRENLHKKIDQAAAAAHKPTRKQKKG